jgi:peptide-methionine (R)-S-oxide reductase
MEDQESIWKESLTPEQYAVLREGATERAGSSNLNKNTDEGVYSCGACNTPLFLSDNKYDSGSGWPSFDRPAREGAVEFREDESHGMKRVEVRCSTCKSHLGHVFPDGPQTTGKRFCINGVALNFKKEDSNNT